MYLFLLTYNNTIFYKCQEYFFKFLKKYNYIKNKKRKNLLTSKKKLCIIEKQTRGTGVCKCDGDVLKLAVRGAPAKGVGWVTGAVVRIHSSPPKATRPIFRLGCFYFLAEAELF